VIDSHAHVHDKAFDEDRAMVIERARAAGVSAIVTVGCDLEDARRALATANEYELYATAGIHPHEAKDAPDDLAAAFAPLLDDARVVAIGETGLDYYYDHSPREAQQRVFREHLRLAKARKLPLIFHLRDAFDDFVAILREEFSSGMRGVVHCFTGDTAQARTYIDEFGLLLGVGGVLTFKTAQPLRDAIRSVGPEPLLLETDCPYLTPVPLRGKRNEPAYIAHTAHALAHVLGSGFSNVVPIADRNARALFEI
jgi:TatD DNase family protein